MIRDRIHDDAAALDHVADLLAPVLREIERTASNYAAGEDVLNEAHDAIADVAAALRAAAIKLRNGAIEDERATLADHRLRETT